MLAESAENQLASLRRRAHHRMIARSNAPEATTENSGNEAMAKCAGAGVPRTQIVMLAAVVGLSIGVLAIYIDARFWDRETREFARSGSFVFWVALLALQTMAWTVALPPLTGTFRRHWEKREPGSVCREVLPSAVTLTLLVATLVIATVHTVGARIRDQIVPLPAPDASDLSEQVSKRKTLNEILGLQISASASFRAGVAILSPLLGALTSLLPKLGADSSAQSSLSVFQGHAHPVAARETSSPALDQGASARQMRRSKSTRDESRDPVERGPFQLATRRRCRCAWQSWTPSQKRDS
jgi:hypothetical protein